MECKEIKILNKAENIEDNDLRINILRKIKLLRPMLFKFFASNYQRLNKNYSQYSKTKEIHQNINNQTIKKTIYSE